MFCLVHLLNQCLEWQSREAHCFHWQKSNFLATCNCNKCKDIGMQYNLDGNCFLRNRWLQALRVRKYGTMISSRLT